MFWFWLAGAGFTTGLCMETSDDKRGFMVVIICIFIWPIVLGSWIRNYLKTKKVTDLREQ